MDTAGLADHLRRTYNIDVTDVTAIESVFAVRRHDGPSWIARVFTEARPIEAVEGDASILRFLETHDYPAERCADVEPVSTFDGCSVLVTTLVDGPNGRPDHRPTTLHAMGDLLGRLQLLPAADGAAARPAGSWHHLSPAGGPRRADIRALEPQLGGRKFAPLRDELARIDLLEDLPHALIHPDFVTANAMLSVDGPVLIDWTGAGHGPRIAPLGFLLSDTDSDLSLVDTIVAGYRRHIELEPDELARLEGAIGAFGVILDCWTGIHHPRFLPHVVKSLPAKRERVAAIAVRARQAFGEPN